MVVAELFEAIHRASRRTRTGFRHWPPVRHWEVPRLPLRCFVRWTAAAS